MTGLTFEADTHTYYLDGVKVSRSVTGVLRRAGLIDFSGIPAATLEAARERGTLVHRAVQLFNHGDLDREAFDQDFPLYRPYLAAWITFTAQRRFTPILSEHLVCSPRLDVAGTIDCLGLLDGRPVLLDFATGDPKDVSKDLQTAGYHLLALEWRQRDPVLGRFFADHGLALQRYAVALRLDGSFRLEPYTNPADARHFATLVEAQRIVAARKGLIEAVA